LNPLETNLVNLLVLDACLFYVLGDIVRGTLDEQLGGVLSELFQRKEKYSKSFRRATRAGKFVAFWNNFLSEPCLAAVQAYVAGGKLEDHGPTTFCLRLNLVAQRANILATRELLEKLPLYPKALSPSLKRFLARVPIVSWKPPFNELSPNPLRRWEMGNLLLKDLGYWSPPHRGYPCETPEGLFPPGPQGNAFLRRSLGMGELGETGRERWRSWRIQGDALQTAREEEYGALCWPQGPIDDLSFRAALMYSRCDERRVERWQSRFRKRISETRPLLSSVPHYRRSETWQKREDYFVEKYGPCLLRTTATSLTDPHHTLADGYEVHIHPPQDIRRVRPWFRLVDPKWSWSVHGVTSTCDTAIPQSFAWYRKAIAPSCREEINRYFGKRLLRFVCSNLS
jgi:hypothetical protein